MSTSRILVTGASGMIGASFCRRLHDSDHEVLAASRTAVPGGVQWNPRVSLGARLEGVDAIVHLAARVHVRGKGFSDRKAFESDNAGATARLVQEAHASGVRRFVFMSSIGVLGSVSNVPLTEDMPVRPHNAYTASKALAEQQLRQFAERSGMEVVILRSPAVIGAGARGNVQSIVNAIRRGVPLPFASIDNRRSFVGLEDLADALLLAVQHEDAGGEILHVASPETWSTPALCEHVARALHVKPRLLPFPPSLLRTGLAAAGRRSLADGLTGDLLVDAKKIKALGWQARETLRASVSKAVVQE